MAKLADAADLKSAGPKGLWGFDSPSRHQDSGVKTGRSLLGVSLVFGDPSRGRKEFPGGPTRVRLEMHLYRQEAVLLKTCRKKRQIKLDWVIVCSKDEYYLIASTARR